MSDATDQLLKDRVDGLARIIDAGAWELYDDPSMTSVNIQNKLVAASRVTAAIILKSGLLGDHTWDRAEYIKAKEDIIRRTSRRGFCYDVEDGLDGYYMHDPKCPRWPEAANGGSGCIAEGGRPRY